MITVQRLLEFESFEDRINVLKLMRSFSSYMRFAYQRLFPLNSRYCDDAISKAKDMLTSCKKRNINPVKIIFGGKNLLEKLKKNHLQGKKREKLIGIDINASPFHIAWSEVDRDGNLNQSGHKRQYLLCHIAHKIIDLAYEKRRAIVIKNIKKLSKGRRGEFKYCPQYLIDKDTAAAFVIGRRGLGFADEIPENYKDLLFKKEFLEYALEILESKKEEFKDQLQSEKNRWKKIPIRRKLFKIHSHIKEVKNQFIQISSEGDSAAQDQASGRNKPVRGLLKKRQKSWRVLRATFIIPLLGKSFVRDFSPLRRILVLGDWERGVSRLVPAPGAGAMGGQKPPGGAGHPEKAEYKYPTQNCTNVQFC